MIVVNEIVRPTIRQKRYSEYNVTAINSAKRTPDRCSWSCHYGTSYCKKHHVKYLKPYYKYTDKIYFGIIKLLQKTGNYGAANVIILVIFFPVMSWLFIMKSIDIELEIRKLKRERGE
jgi:hypothetical protein